MSLFNNIAIHAKHKTKLFALSLLLVQLLLVLGSCGFKPMYSQISDDSSIAAKLSAVKVKQIDSILGQKYVSSLQDILDPGNFGSVKEYVFEAKLTKDVRALAIERDRTVTRFKVVVTATYTIKKIDDGKVLASGVINNEADYDKVDSDYATYVSENDTTDRALKELAQDTKIKIMSALLK